MMRSELGELQLELVRVESAVLQLIEQRYSGAVDPALLLSRVESLLHATAAMEHEMAALRDARMTAAMALTAALHARHHVRHAVTSDFQNPSNTTQHVSELLFQLKGEGGPSASSSSSSSSSGAAALPRTSRLGRPSLVPVPQPGSRAASTTDGPKRSGRPR